ncbi:MAG: response regulator [Methylococcales bacterium]|jgi:CheY-like chemotaxis protein|nr:response regulator [Methylococcales bacterium]MBT7442733.1 response regulator [Methylococcales bacterium]
MNPTILVVDDEPFNIEIIEAHLTPQYHCVSAEDGAIAWHLLDKNPMQYSVVLLDQMMPNMTGLELLKKLKGDRRFKHLQVILQTAKARQQDMMEGIQAGAQFYLTKPFESAMLKTMVKAAINDYELHQELNLKIAQQNKVMETMIQGDMTFIFKMLQDGKDLASAIANLFPEPQRVLNGLSELITNAIEHGNLGITYKEKTELLKQGRWLEEVNERQAQDQYKNKVVNIVCAKHKDRVSVTITDEGEGFDWEQYLQIDPARAFDPHGRGIAMANLMSFDKLTYLGPGNKVEARITIDQD